MGADGRKLRMRKWKESNKKLVRRQKEDESRRMRKLWNGLKERQDNKKHWSKEKKERWERKIEGEERRSEKENNGNSRIDEGSVEIYDFWLSFIILLLLDECSFIWLAILSSPDSQQKGSGKGWWWSSEDVKGDIKKKRRTGRIKIEYFVCKKCWIREVWITPKILVILWVAKRSSPMMSKEEGLKNYLLTSDVTNRNDKRVWLL